MNKISVLLAATALTLPLAASAQASELPPRKAGLWEITTTIEKPQALPAMTTKMCLDRATDRELMEYGLKLSDDKCKTTTTRRDSKTLLINVDCTSAGSPTKTKAVISGDFQSGYTMRLQGSSDEGEVLMTQAATWKGASCPGMKAGDISMFGGVKVNVKQLKALSGLIR